MPEFAYPAYDFSRCAKCKHQRGTCLPPEDGTPCPNYEPEDDD